MKQKYFYFLGSILIILSIIFIINPGDSKELTKSEISQEEIITNEEVQDKESVSEPETEETPLKDSEEDTKPKAIPDRIAEVVQSTIDFFQKNNTKIVAIGDSLTQGVGDSTKQGGYVGILERTINETEKLAEFENFGKRGNRSSQLLKRLDNEEIVTSISKADIVLITIGANDIMQVAKENIMDLSLHDFIEERVNYENNLKKIVKRVQAMNKNVDIYLIGFYNPFEKYFQDIDELDMITETFNSTTSDIANQYDNVTFIPTEDLFANSDINLFAEDNFHPNYQGYHRIAERVLNYITNEES